MLISIIDFLEYDFGSFYSVGLTEDFHRTSISVTEILVCLPWAWNHRAQKRSKCGFADSFSIRNKMKWLSYQCINLTMRFTQE